MACLFLDLEDESRSIYEERPLASCREYLVNSPAENCSEPSGGKINLIELPAGPSEVLRQIGESANLNKIVNFLPLILALKWKETY